MAFEPAPFHGAESEGPGGGSAFWTRAEDGVRIRVGGWRAGERGTVVVFNGRNEFIEKYGRLATDFAGSGYAAASCDWRSQGLADRLSDTPMLGHIERFTDFQKDAAAFLDWLEAQGYPKPWHLVAHSMGGLIALRHVHGPHPFATITFSSPMWGIGFPLPLRIAAPASADRCARNASLIRSKAPGRSASAVRTPTSSPSTTSGQPRHEWTWPVSSWDVAATSPS